MPEKELLKCCMCSSVPDVGYKMPNGDIVCATYECCYEYCKNEGTRVFPDDEKD